MDRDFFSYIALDAVLLFVGLLIHYFATVYEVSGSGDLFPRLLAGAGGGLLAESLTLPTDVIKVRLQVQRVIGSRAQTGAGTKARPIYSGMLDCGMKIAKNEGAMSLWKGYVPAILRQVCYSSLMMVVYEPVRIAIATSFNSGSGNSLSENATPSFGQRLLAGGIAGGISIAVFNPFEVAKTQIQSDASGRKTVMSVFRNVYVNEGIGGFWAGVQPNVMRTFLVNAAELGAYDQAKTELFAPLFGDGLLAHVASSGVAGFCSACISTPCDVVKTRVMNAAGAKEKQHSGIIDTFLNITKEEGFLALYSGFVPICVRKLIWCAVFFVCYERIRAFAQ